MGGVIQHCLEDGFVAGAHIGLAHRIQVGGAAHQSLSEAGVLAVYIVFGRFQVVSGGINLFQGLQDTFIVCGLVVRDQASAHKSMGPVVESSFLVVSVLRYNYGIRLPVYEGVVFAGEHTVHHPVQTASGLVEKGCVSEDSSCLKTAVQPVGALLQKPSGAADFAVPIRLACGDIFAQPSVLEHLLVFVQMAGDAVRCILRPLFEPAIGLDLPQVQRGKAYGGLHAGSTAACRQQYGCQRNY